MVELKEGDLKRVLETLPPQVVRMLRMSGLFLAGGFIRAVVAGEEPSDIDIFSSSKEEAKRWAKILASSLGSNGAYESPNAITISKSEPTVQFITRWLFSLSSDVIKSFDFTIAQAIIFYSKDVGAWLGYCSEEFYPDTENKILRYTSPDREEDAAGSLLRVNKFLSRGYSISDEDLAKVVARVGEAAQREKKRMASLPLEDVEASFEEPTEPYRRVIKAARPSGGGSV